MKPVGRKVPTNITNKTVNAVGWAKINGKRHVESDGPNAEGGMEHYSVNVGYVDVRFMCGNGKWFNVS
jgi:tartrate dehydratase beta subunit/fumarate hydratase class I family protein